MSDTAATPEMQAIIARIERDYAETRRIVDEREKFMAEARKLNAEADKLHAEQMKLVRDRNLAPWLVAAGVLGGVITLGQLLLRALGILT